MIKREFGEVAHIVRKYREAKGMSQTALSNALGYKNGQFISNVERGLCSVPLKKYVLICKILDINLYNFIDHVQMDFKKTVTRETQRQAQNNKVTITEQGFIKA